MFSPIDDGQSAAADGLSQNIASDLLAGGCHRWEAVLVRSVGGYPYYEERRRIRQVEEPSKLPCGRGKRV